MDRPGACLAISPHGHQIGFRPGEIGDGIVVWADKIYPLSGLLKYPNCGITRQQLDSGIGRFHRLTEFR